MFWFTRLLLTFFVILPLAREVIWAPEASLASWSYRTAWFGQLACAIATGFSVSALLQHRKHIAMGLPNAIALPALAIWFLWGITAFAFAGSIDWRAIATVHFFLASGWAVMAMLGFELSRRATQLVGAWMPKGAAAGDVN